MPGMRRLGKNYSVLIIPERGSSTKRLQLSTYFLRAIGVLVGILLIGGFLSVTLFSNRYNKMVTSSKEIETLAGEQTNYIETLQNELAEQQKEIEAQQKRIEEQEVYQKVIDQKLEEIDALEQEVKEKIEKTQLFTQSEWQSDLSPRVVNVGYTTQVSIEEVDKRIETLQELSETLDELYEKEQRMPSVWPASGRYTSGFGWRQNPFGSGMEFHTGIDIANSYGTRIVATAKGVVTQTGYTNGYGNMVMINHGNGFVSIYGHNSSVSVEVGQTVEKGQTIARMGSTGRSTGVHVHFEIRQNGTAINPYNILN